jgi:putative transposase
MLVLEYKIKAKPQQYKAIDEAIRTVQFVRNKCIRHWMDAPKDAKINRFALNKYSTELRNEFSFVKELNSMAVQAAAERGWLAISRFYDNCKSKKSGKKGFPKFQKDNRSVEYKISGWSLHPAKRRITITDKKGIGELKLLGKWNIHSIPVKSIKRVRLVRRADGYYCQFAVDVECIDIQPLTGQEIGLDVGLEFFYTDSNGHQEPNPKFLRKAESGIKHAQRAIYKLAVAVPPHYTSQECSQCKVIVKKSLSTRTHVCSCGLVLQRDWNAAINILLKAKSTGGHPGSNATGVETSTLLGASLVEQVLTMNVESHAL